MNKKQLAFVAIFAVGAGSASAQYDEHSGHDMAPGMGHGSAVDHSDHAAGSEMSATPPDDMSPMDHGAHTMNSGQTEELRDPDAYSEGYEVSPELHLHMGDEHAMSGVMVERLETVDSSDASFTVYDLQAWYGRDYDRALLKAEGEVDSGKLEDASTELLWSHAVSSFWNGYLGVRYDSGEVPDRAWLALGVDGLAPYWVEMDAALYVGESGRTALAVEAEYDLSITQRLVLQTRFETELYGKSDPELYKGSGLTEAVLGFRLRYEVMRELAPYVGVEWVGKFGDTADYLEQAGAETHERRFVGGLRFWF